MIRGRTFYQILQVDSYAETEIIGVVYRRLAQRYHPDHDDSDIARQRMVEINQAWEVLEDVVRREAYDAELAQRRDRREMDRYVKQTVDTQPEPGYGEAGVPVGPPSGSLITFGRYRGWTMSQILRKDRDFLEWFQRHPAGRQFRTEIEALIGRPAGSSRG